MDEKARPDRVFFWDRPRFAPFLGFGSVPGFEAPMISITLPDGSARQFDKAVTAAEVAAAIGPGLAKAALGAKVDGKLVDLGYRLERDARLAIVTDKNPEGLE